MPGAAEHARVVLSAILDGGRGSMRALEYAQARLEPGHFEDRTLRKLFLLLVGYADQTRGIITRDALADMLREQDPGTALAYQVQYDTLAAEAPTGPEFKHSVTQLRQLRARAGTGDVLAQGLQILNHGVRDDRGAEVRGHEAARAHVLAGLAEVEREAGLAVTPEGDVTREGDQVLEAYTRARELRHRGEEPGVRLGLPELDDYLGMVPPGALGLVVSWTSRGKTSLCVQFSWHASVMQGKNVVIFTTETLRDQVRCKLAARHSRLPQFGLRRGLDDLDIRAGRLDEDGERALQAVLADWKTGGYGRCNVVQMPDTGTISWIESRLAAIRRRYPVHLVVVDYFQLLSPERSSRESRLHEDQGGIVKAAKTRLAVAHQVPVISPWQVNRTGRAGLKVNGGGYDLEDLSNTAEAANTPDLVLTLVDREEDTSAGRMAPLELTVIKNRGGPKGRRFHLVADYATSCFEPRHAVDPAALGLDELCGRAGA